MGLYKAPISIPQLVVLIDQSLCMPAVSCTNLVINAPSWHELQLGSYLKISILILDETLIDISDTKFEGRAELCVGMIYPPAG
jgi:hypothetical protein